MSQFEVAVPRFTHGNKNLLVEKSSEAGYAVVYFNVTLLDDVVLRDNRIKELQTYRKGSVFPSLYIAVNTNFTLKDTDTQSTLCTIITCEFNSDEDPVNDCDDLSVNDYTFVSIVSK